MSDGIQIQEAQPDGAGSYKALLDCMLNSVKRSDDMSDTFRELVPEIQELIKYEFSQSNPAGWDPLTAKYVKWKQDHGYPVTIGIMTGALRDALTDSAVVDIQPKELNYKLNEGVAGYKGKTTGSYAKWFNKHRKIMKYVRKIMKERIKRAVTDAILLARFK